ncbi:LuxR C-terminal-related transcriptional regulator [Streptomyces sp. DSM 15324]|uniref:helix-turn-helix transcriptional regulator n=1 Tax=Streptomyces sp. DSM 15324 TaxID=1739111 RepID=UPI00082AB4AC
MDERRHTARLVETFEPLPRLAPGPGAGPEASAIGVLSGHGRINDAITSGGHPAALRYFASAFARLRNLATPMYPEAVRQPAHDRVTPRRRAIAALLVEGHTDTVIADRLGMNVRTARVHIAGPAARLGSESRAQLGHLIARSGILDQERDPT